MSGSRSFSSPRGRAPRSRDSRDSRSDERLPSQRSPLPQLPRPRNQDSCYNRYEIPVRDGQDLHSDSTETYNVVKGTGTGDSEHNSITNSMQDKIEEIVRKNAPRDTEVFDDALSIESSIKFFRTTVEKIFETFYCNLQDLETYKKRFNDIIEKRAYSVREMEDFVKDMLNDIVSTDISLTSCSQRTDGYELKTRETNTTTTSMSEALLDNLQSVVEAYKNDNYMTDSTQDDTPKRYGAKREVFNVYLLNNTPNLHISVNDRTVLSEIVIKDQNHSAESKVASAENIRKLKAKRIEMEKREGNVDYSSSDREIPVKTSSAKKNIHSTKECASEISSTPEKTENKSFMAKICDYLCKKLRKSSFL